MYNYDTMLEVVQANIAELTDPRETTEDPIYMNVEIGRPTMLDFWNNVGATLLFGDVIKTEEVGSNNQQKIQTLQGAVITYVPGIDGPAVLKMLHLTDIVGDFFERKNSLGIPGVSTELLPSTSQGWRIADIGKILNIKLPQLKLTSTGTTIFLIHLPKQPERTAEGKIKNRF
jgi:hypothetical protein